MHAQIYSSLEATTGLYWCAAQDATRLDPLGVKRLMVYATPTRDPARQRIVQAAKRHIAVLAQRPAVLR